MHVNCEVIFGIMATTHRGARQTSFRRELGLLSEKKCLVFPFYSMECIFVLHIYIHTFNS